MKEIVKLKDVVVMREALKEVLTESRDRSFEREILKEVMTVVL